MLHVSLKFILINIKEIITSFKPYSKHFIAMPIMRFELLFALILFIALSVISIDPTWIISMPSQSSFKIAVMKWSNLLTVAPLKLL